MQFNSWAQLGEPAAYDRSAPCNLSMIQQTQCGYRCSKRSALGRRNVFFPKYYLEDNVVHCLVKLLITLPTPLPPPSPQVEGGRSYLYAEQASRLFFCTSCCPLSVLLGSELQIVSGALDKSFKSLRASVPPSVQWG